MCVCVCVCGCAGVQYGRYLVQVCDHGIRACTVLFSLVRLLSLRAAHRETIIGCYQTKRAAFEQSVELSWAAQNQIWWFHIPQIMEMIVLVAAATGKTEQTALKVLVCWSKITPITTYFGSNVLTLLLLLLLSPPYNTLCCVSFFPLTCYIFTLWLVVFAWHFFSYSTLCFLCLLSFLLFLRILYYDFFSVVDCLCSCWCCIQNLCGSLMVEASTFEFYVSLLQYLSNCCGESIKRINTPLCAYLNQIEQIICSQCVTDQVQNLNLECAFNQLKLVRSCIKEEEKKKKKRLFRTISFCNAEFPNHIKMWS